ncbi:hypothetical protein [Helicobacter salomonis]|uniref:hypothetical protein n=1 Tax=Helicobacter salomonis TaxID=56878 RepID=UPI000CF0E762|nr:hypothetical protein [Helicobacter salomonis]
MHVFRSVLLTSVAGLTLPVSGMLQAENNGFYGAVGFQYSNMTKGTQTTTPGYVLDKILPNPFDPQNTQPVPLPPKQG